MVRPLSKREMAAAVLGNPIVGAAMRASSAGGLRILAYHRVLDNPGESFPFDDGVISASTGSFRRQMDFIKRNFDVLTFADVLACENEGRKRPDRSLIITFDDGYRDNYINAFPVLKELGLPATIFLATNHIGRSSLFWWDLIAYCVKTTQMNQVLLEEVCSKQLSLRSRTERQNSIEAILRWVKQVPESVKRSFLEGLPTRLDVRLPENVADKMTFSWDEARSMAANGIEFGSHTSSHPVLANVDPDSLEEEIAGSKRTIERELGREVIAFAYPVGGKGHFTGPVQEVVKRAKYRYAVSYEEGLAGDDWQDRYALPRIHIESDHSLSLFRANLMFPQAMLRP